MSRTQNLAMLMMLLLGAIASGSALAHGPRVGFGIVIGEPIYSPWYYPPPYYYYPPPVVVQSAPPVYVERDDVSQQQQRQDDWFYCANPRGYYPYVKKCPGGWQRVASQPPGP